MTSLDRRDALRLLLGASSIPLLPLDMFALFQKAQAAGSAPAFRTLTAPQEALVATIAELIVPATDTPGAREARVSEFIDVMLTDWFEEVHRRRFLDGLDQFEGECHRLFARNFTEATPDQQAQLIAGADDALAYTREVTPSLNESSSVHDVDEDVDYVAGKNFFSMMKRLTLIGYYTSEAGSQQELKEKRFFQKYEGDVPLTPEAGTQ